MWTSTRSWVITIGAAAVTLTACADREESAPRVDPELAAAAEEACAEFCADLQNQGDACPGAGGGDLFTGAGTAGPNYPATCSTDLAFGADLVTAVRSRLEDSAPALGEALPDLAAALERAEAGYADYAASRCSGLAPELTDAGAARACSELVAETVRWQVAVGRELAAVAG